MKFLNGTLPTLVENLALEEALLLEAEEGACGEVLRIWEWPSPVVVLGAGCSISADVNQDVCKRDQVPVLRRASGGGTVLLGQGCFCYTLILNMTASLELGTITSSYAAILGRIRSALADRFPLIARAGISDLALGGRKFSGNAQQRKRTYLLHHGTILYAYDLSRIALYLRLPDRRPEYRMDRPHQEFLMNLPMSPSELAVRLANQFKATELMEEVPMNRVADLVARKYGQAAWIERR